MCAHVHSLGLSEMDAFADHVFTPAHVTPALAMFCLSYAVSFVI